MEEVPPRGITAKIINAHKTCISRCAGTVKGDSSVKSDIHRLVSLEHAKTRGYVNLALHNTQMLHRALVRLMWAGALVLIVLVILIGMVGFLWFRL